MVASSHSEKWIFSSPSTFWAIIIMADSLSETSKSQRGRNYASLWYFGVNQSPFQYMPKCVRPRKLKLTFGISRMFKSNNAFVVFFLLWYFFLRLFFFSRKNDTHDWSHWSECTATHSEYSPWNALTDINPMHKSQILRINSSLIGKKKWRFTNYWSSYHFRRRYCLRWA